MKIISNTNCTIVHAQNGKYMRITLENKRIIWKDSSNILCGSYTSEILEKEYQELTNAPSELKSMEERGLRCHNGSDGCDGRVNGKCVCK